MAQLANLVVQHDMAVTLAVRVHHDNKGLQAGLREAQARAEEAEARQQAAQARAQSAERRAVEADRRAAAAESRAAAALSRWAGLACGGGAMLGDSPSQVWSSTQVPHMKCGCGIIAEGLRLPLSALLPAPLRSICFCGITRTRTGCR